MILHKQQLITNNVGLLIIIAIHSCVSRKKKKKKTKGKKIINIHNLLITKLFSSQPKNAFNVNIHIYIYIYYECIAKKLIFFSYR
jgi:hypothetical protein